MTTATLTMRRPTLFERRTVAVGLLLLGAMVTAGAVVAGNGNPILALAPVALAFCAYAFYVLPIRYTLFALVFLSLTLDAVEEGPWSSPLAPLGSLLTNNLNKSIPIAALVVPGAAVIMLAMMALMVHRSLVGSRTDSQDRTPAALPLYGALALSFVTVLLLVGLGQVRGGNVQMAKIQVQSYLLLLIAAYLAAMSLRGMHDYRILGRIIVAAAVARSFYVAFVVQHLSGRLAEGETILVAATHGDSLLFSIAAVLLVVRFMEKPSRWAAVWCLALIPILLVGMNLNNRRLVWVEVAAGLLTFVLVSRRSRAKRVLASAALLALPLIVGYVAVGWNSQARVFAPIKMYRSVTDGTVDPSTLYRDLENYNLMMTMRLYPMTGIGFGQQFVETVTLPDISSVFMEYRYMPHNSILALWTYTGPFGFTGLSMALVIAMYFAVRSYRMAGSADERTAAVMVIATVAIYFMHCWGDMGFSERRTVFLVGPALAIAGQLAHKTGAFRSQLHASRL